MLWLGTSNFNYEILCYKNYAMNISKHYSGSFYQVIAEFKQFSAFSLFLTFDHFFF